MPPTLCGRGACGSVIKTVRWRDDDVWLSAGNDGVLAVCDSRLATGYAVCKMETGGVVNTAEWCPSQEHVLGVCGFSPTIQLYDIRRPSESVHRLSSHVAPGITRCKAIYQFRFSPSGRARSP